MRKDHDGLECTLEMSRSGLIEGVYLDDGSAPVGSYLDRYRQGTFPGWFELYVPEEAPAFVSAHETIPKGPVEIADRVKLSIVSAQFTRKEMKKRHTHVLWLMFEGDSVPEALWALGGFLKWDLSKHELRRN